MSQHPLKFCSYCRRDVQHRDNVPNCFHCDMPFKFGPDAEEKKSEIEYKLGNEFEWEIIPARADIYECPVCGAVVGSACKHAEWHKEIGR